MHLLVDHHQHQVVALITRQDRLQALLNILNTPFVFTEGFAADGAEGLRAFLAGHDHGPQCHLLGPDQNDPMVVFADKAIGVSEGPHGVICLGWG